MGKHENSRDEGVAEVVARLKLIERHLQVLDLEVRILRAELSQKANRAVPLAPARRAV